MSLQLWKKKMAIIAAMNKEYLLDVSGNPAVLAAAIKKPLQGVTVYGAAGGVGDSDLPSGYTQLEYIESTGTQYIDTGVVGNQNTRILIDFDIGTMSQTSPLFGSQSNDGPTYIDAIAFWKMNNGSVVRVDYGSQPYPFNTAVAGNRYILDYNKNVVVFNEEIHEFTTQTFANSSSILLFSCNTNGTADTRRWAGKTYSCKMYNNDALVRNFVPAKRNSDNEIGMYDTVTGTFFTNSGTGDFIAGREIYKIPVLMGDKTLGDVINDFKSDHDGAIQYLENDAYVRIPVAFGRYRATDADTATPLLWSVADTQYMSDGAVSLICETNIGNKYFDAAEPTNPDTTRQTRGSNRWKTSNVRQWLQSDGVANGWFTAQTEYDAMPNYANNNGFLRDFTAEEKSSILTKDNNLVLADIDGGGTEVVTDSVWLLSAYEAGMNSPSEPYPSGQKGFEIFPDNNARKAFGNLLLRSALRPTMPGTINWVYESAGTLSTHWANNADLSNHPCLNISPDTPVVWNAELDAWEVKPERAAGNKTINLYTDAPLIHGDDLRVDITNQTAYRGTTDISALQDWEQDFELAKGDNTVSVGTNVQPSAVEWRYLSTVKGASVPYWGVSFIGSNTTGTRTGNAVGLTASISTNTTAGASDFDSVPAFQQVRVNGHFNADGSFTETAVEGIDSAFAVDGSNGDVWVRFRKSYYRKVIDGSDDTREVTHLPKVGFSVHPLFRNNCTGAETDYAYIAAYKMGWNERDEKVASISGVPLCQSTYANRNANIANKGLSYNTCLDFTRAKDSNGQYSGMTTVELDFLTTLFMIEFANRSSQAVMGDCTSYNIQVKAVAAETGVEHITVSTTNAAKFVVGSVVSLGTSTDRNAVACHSIVNRKKITAIDTATGIITIDNGGVTFDTTTNTYITTMPYYTGETDSILGHTGTPANNGKHTNKYRGVEDMYGQTWCILADTIATGSPSVIYRCDDPTQYAKSITGSYAAVGYHLAASNGYVTALGYDTEHPYISMTTAVGGNANTYYGGYYYMVNNTSAREVFYGGGLHSADYASLCFFAVSDSLSVANWNVAARLSGCGWRG